MVLCSGKFYFNVSSWSSQTKYSDKQNLVVVAKSKVLCHVHCINGEFVT